ncbi:MAG: hypothetical protein H8E05_00025 [Bacteroidetes bacterium]|nr:hypothetical protein [Bacteroidota bacterium]
MDFVYDLAEKLEEQKIDYFLVTVRSGEDKDTADVFYNFQNERSAECLTEVLNNLDAYSRSERENEDTKNGKNDKKTSPKKRGRPPKKKDGEE